MENMEMYTMQDWERDGSLSPKIGQIVADDVVEELINCMPPATYSNEIFQMGEPASHDWDTGEPKFGTFKRAKEGWRYLGKLTINQARR